MASKRQLQRAIDNLSFDIVHLRKENVRLQEENAVLTSRQDNAFCLLEKEQAVLNWEYKARMDSEKMIGVLRKANTELQFQQGRHLVALGRKQAQLDKQAQVFEALERTQRRLDKEIEVRTESYEYASALEKANEMGSKKLCQETASRKEYEEMVGILQEANDKQSKRIVALEQNLRSQLNRMVQLVNDFNADFNFITT